MSESSPRDLFAEILHGTRAVVYVKDRQGRYTFVNRHFEDLFEISAERLRGRTDEEVFGAEVAALQAASDAEVFAQGHVVEMRGSIPGDPSGVPHVTYKFPIEDPGGGVSGIYGIVSGEGPDAEAERLMRGRLPHLSDLVRAHSQELLQSAAELHREIEERAAEASRLIESRSTLRAVQDSVIDALITIDHRGIIQTVNKSTEQIFGYRPEELRGRNISILMPEPYRSEHDEYIARYLRTGENRVIGIGRQVSGRRKDGTLFPADLAISEVEGKPLFVGIVRDITERLRVESEREELSQRIIAVQEDERNRIARDIHDALGQSLVALKFQIQRIVSAHNDERLTRECDELTTYINDIIRTARDLSHSLTPMALQNLGLRRAVEELGATTERTHSVRVHVDLEAADDFFPHDWNINVYRIIQEAMNNACRHASAQHVDILATRTKRLLRIVVSDDGSGLPAGFERGDAGPFRNAHSGMGLLIMRERARILGGDFQIRSASKGTEVVLEIPK